MSDKYMRTLIVKLTPLHGIENSSFQRLGEPRMKSAGLLFFTFERLEIVQATLARDFTLKLLHLVKGHSRRVGP